MTKLSFKSAKFIESNSKGNVLKFVDFKLNNFTSPLIHFRPNTIVELSEYSDTPVKTKLLNFEVNQPIGETDDSNFLAQNNVILAAIDDIEITYTLPLSMFFERLLIENYFKKEVVSEVPDTPTNSETNQSETLSTNSVNDKFNKLKLRNITMESEIKIQNTKPIFVGTTVSDPSPVIEKQSNQKLTYAKTVIDNIQLITTNITKDNVSDMTIKIQNNLDLLLTVMSM